MQLEGTDQRVESREDVTVIPSLSFFGSLAACLHGSLAACLRGSLAPWLLGSLAAWLIGWSTSRQGGTRQLS